MHDEREAEIPQFRDRLRHVKYEEGQDVVFVCQIAGHPPPNVSPVAYFYNHLIPTPCSSLVSNNNNFYLLFEIDKYAVGLHYIVVTDGNKFNRSEI